MTLAITRPEGDVPGLAAELRQRGHEVVIAPLLEIRARVQARLPRTVYQAIAVTSANGMRFSSPALMQQLDLNTPVFAVGAQSAASARARGFHHVSAEGGDVDGLLHFLTVALQAQDGPVLYLSGAETSGDLEGKLRRQGFDVDRVMTYDAIPLQLDAQRAALETCQGVLLYSPRSAKLWVAEMQRLSVDITNKKHFCLSTRVAQSLPPNTHISVSSAAHEEAMLGLLDLPGKAE